MTATEVRGRPDALVVRVAVVAAALALTLPAASGVEPWPSGLLAQLTVALCVWGLAGACDHGARISQLVFWAFSLAWLGVAPLYQLAVGRLAWGDRSLLAMRDTVVAAQLLILLSLVAFLLGARSRRVGRNPDPAALDRGADLDPDRTARAAALVTGLSLVLLPLAAQASGGFANLFVSRQERSAALAAEGLSDAAGGGVALGLLKLLPAALATVGCYFAIRALREEVRTRPFARWRLSRVVLAVGATAMLLTYSNPIANSRFISFAAIGACLLAAWQPRSVRAATGVAATAVLGLLFAYPLAFALRRAGGPSPADTFSLTDWSGPDFDGFQQWVNTVTFVEDNGIEWGSTIVSAVLVFLPRSLWEGKEIPASITIAEHRGYAFTDLSLPVSAELYLNLGALGVAAGMFLMGRVWARLDDAWLTAPGSAAGMLAPLVATQQLGLIRGPMGSLAPLIGSVVVLALLVIAHGRRRPHHGGTR